MLYIQYPQTSRNILACRDFATSYMVTNLKVTTSGELGVGQAYYLYIKLGVNFGIRKINKKKIRGTIISLTKPYKTISKSREPFRPRLQL